MSAVPVSLVRQRNYRSEYHVLTGVNALKTRSHQYSVSMCRQIGQDFSGCLCMSLSWQLTRPDVQKFHSPLLGTVVLIRWCTIKGGRDPVHGLVSPNPRPCQPREKHTELMKVRKGKYLRIGKKTTDTKGRSRHETNTNENDYAITEPTDTKRA